MTIRSKEDEAIAVLTDAAAGMDQDVVADQRTLNRRVRTDIAVLPILTLTPITAPEPITRPGANFGVWADHGKRIDNHAIFQTRRRIDDGGRRNAGIAEPGLRAKRVAMHQARDLHKFTERMNRAQNGEHGRARWPRSDC